MLYCVEAARAPLSQRAGRKTSNAFPLGGGGRKVMFKFMFAQDSLCNRGGRQSWGEERPLGCQYLNKCVDSPKSRLHFMCRLL